MPNSLSYYPDFSIPQTVLAPMEGLTDPLMREVLTSIGKYDWTVSEFIRITQTVLPAHVFYKYVPELQHAGELQGRTKYGTPVYVQLLGSEPALLADNAARACELGAHAIDLNFGCPAKTVNNHRGGSILLTDPETIYQIISQVRRAVPSHIPVSAKIRLGYEDTSQTQAIGEAVAAAKASWLTVHARTKVQGYKPPAYWELIAPLTQHLDLPIIANGEIWTTSDAQRCQEQSGTLHLMLGRGAVTRPDLVNQIRAMDAQQAFTPLSWHALVTLQIAFLQGQAKNEKVLVGRSKQWLGMLTQGYAPAQILWQQLKRVKTLAQILEILSPFSLAASPNKIASMDKQDPTPTLLSETLPN